MLLQKCDIFTKQAASSSFEVDFVTPTPGDFPDFHTFNHRQGNKSVKSTVALECWNEKNGVTACPYSVVVYSPHVLSVVVRCTKMPLLRLAVNIVFLSFWELFSSEAKKERSFWREKILRKLTWSVSLQSSSVAKYVSICNNSILLKTNKHTIYFNKEKIKDLKCMIFFCISYIQVFTVADSINNFFQSFWSLTS